MPRRRFTDGAGYTRHCWECKHAKDWEDRPHAVYEKRAKCELTGVTVDKWMSPDNPCSHVPNGCDYSH